MMTMPHFLVVDDSSVIRKVARRICEELSFTVSEAEDGQQALDICRDAMPDVILVDWSMPVMDGYEFMRELRKMDGGKHPKVIFCTAENDVALVARAMRAGADDHLLKPFDKEIIESKLHEVGVL